MRWSSEKSSERFWTTAGVWLVVGLWGAFHPVRVKRYLIGPRHSWSLWFAWFPVTLERQNPDKVWL